MASRRLLKGYFVFDQKRVNRRLVTWNTEAGNSLSQLPLCARYFHKHRWRSRCEHAHSQGGKEGWAQPAAGLWLLSSHADGPLSTNVYETRKRFLIALSSCWENKVKTPRSSKGWSIYLTWSYRRFPTVAHSWTPTWVWSFPSWPSLFHTPVSPLALFSSKGPHAFLRFSKATCPVLLAIKHSALCL